MLSIGVLVPAAAADETARPFAATLVGSAGPVPDLGCPIGLRTASSATGIATHLGAVTMTASHCTPNPPFGPVIGPIVGGQVTFFAANGDTLFGTYAGTVDPAEFVEGAVISGDAHVMFTGGTGRFADASGSADQVFSGTLHLDAPLTMTWIMDGAIGY